MLYYSRIQEDELYYKLCGLDGERIGRLGVPPIIILFLFQLYNKNTRYRKSKIVIVNNLMCLKKRRILALDRIREEKGAYDYKIIAKRWIPQILSSINVLVTNIFYSHTMFLV